MRERAIASKARLAAWKPLGQRRREEVRAETIEEIRESSNASGRRGWEGVRAEVEVVVRLVVPEEAGNIDEMMAQFGGQEEELVEALRWTREHHIASGARLGQHHRREEVRAEVKAIASGAREELFTSCMHLDCPGDFPGSFDLVRPNANKKQVQLFICFLSSQQH